MNCFTRCMTALWVWQGVIFVQVPDSGLPGNPPDKETRFSAIFAAALNLSLPKEKGAPSPRCSGGILQARVLGDIGLTMIGMQPHVQPCATRSRMVPRPTNARLADPRPW